MSNYRHVKTRIIVSKSNIAPYYLSANDPNTRIPAGLVESSSEWTQLGKPLFVTSDGVQMYEGDYWWYVTLCSNPHVARTNTTTYAGKAESIKPIRNFSNEFAARDFAKSITNSPVLTVFELELLAAELKISKTTLNLIKSKFSKK